MRKTTLALLAAGATLLACSSSASTYFYDPFNVNPVITGSQTEVAGAWFWDRYRPFAFDSQSFLGDNRLHIRIDAADGVAPNSTGPGRPWTGTFYNTQGRQFKLGNGAYTSIKAKLYVGADWSSNHRRSDIWGVISDATDTTVTGYPILGFANTDGSSLICRAWDDDNGIWYDVSSKVPGGVTTNRWYTLEITLKPGCVQYWVDGVLVYNDLDPTDGGGIYGTQFHSMILQGYNFNDPALPLANQTSGESYDIYWDDLTVGPISQQGFPVDLNGSYRAASSGPLNPTVRSADGFAIAATGPIDFSGGYVFERGGVNPSSAPENALNGSFTPFNDVTKQPNALSVTNVNGTAMEADVELSGTWKPFQWGQGIGNVPPFATGDTFNVGWANANNSFGVMFSTTLGGNYIAKLASTKYPSGALGLLETNGTPATLPAGTTKVRLNASVASGYLTATVMPLDGPAAYTVYTLGTTNGSNLDTNVPWTITTNNMIFVAGFTSMENPAAAANATLSNFSTSAVPNALFAFCDDPYVRSVDPNIGYRVGQANLAQSITGWQGFMFNGAGQAFGSFAYAGPYGTFNPPAALAYPNAAAANAWGNQANLTVGSLLFTPGGSEVATGMGFQANSGTNVNLFSGDAPSFTDVLANTFGSNTVVIDNTAPAIGTPTLSGTGYVAPNVVPGNLNIDVVASDPGAQQSGLDGRPAGSITWSDASVTPVSMFSLVGNTFRAIIPITSGTPNGTATLNLQVCDRAGNCSTTTLTFNVSTVNLYLTVQERGVTANVTREIKMTFGGGGGGNAPILVTRVLNFNTPVVVSGDNSREATTLVTYQDLDLADDSLANNSVPVAAAFTQVHMKDRFFSLAKKVGLSGTPGAFTATVTLRMGDLTDNNIVNVSDLAVWAANNGSAQSANTTLGQGAIPRQANADGVGIVDLGDRNLIIAAWLLAGDGPVGFYGGGGGGASGGGASGNGRQRVMDVILETGLNKAVVKSMDLNNDGWITREEILSWSAGKR